jgi:hypothetical protein
MTETVTETGPGPRAAALPRIQIALVVAVLAGSAGLRAWQASNATAASRVEAPPFPLEEIPLRIGDWVGEEGKLDSRTANTAGALDSISRTYLDPRTGVRLQVLVLYGPAERLKFHAPTVCFPAAGFEQDGLRRPLAIPSGDREIPFLSVSYRKARGGGDETREVVWSWHYRDRWSTELKAKRYMERIGGMFKVHIERLVAPDERLEAQSNPTRRFLERFMPEIEARLAAAAPAPAGDGDGAAAE